MASVEAGSALLTAESIIIAAASIALQQDKLYNGLIDLVPIWVLGLFGISLAFSLLSSCYYLYLAEFRDEHVVAKAAFIAALGNLLLPIYGFGALIALTVINST